MTTHSMKSAVDVELGWIAMQVSFLPSHTVPTPN